MTEKLINSKPNGVVALILIELALVLGVFIFIIGAGSENIFGIIIGLLLILISVLAHAGLKVVKPQEALVLTPLVIIQEPSKNLVFTLSILLA